MYVLARVMPSTPIISRISSSFHEELYSNRLVKQSYFVMKKKFIPPTEQTRTANMYWTAVNAGGSTTIVTSVKHESVLTGTLARISAKKASECGPYKKSLRTQPKAFFSRARACFSMTDHESAPSVSGHLALSGYPHWWEGTRPCPVTSEMV